MGHRLSQGAFMAKCYQEKEEEYANIAKQLLLEEKATIFYRESVRITYHIRGEQLITTIFNSDGDLTSETIDYRFMFRIDNYIEELRFNFASDEAEAREIYNHDAKRRKMNL